MTRVIEGMLVLPNEVRLGQVTIVNGQIGRVTLDEAAFVEPDVRVPRSLFVSPGFVDIQINGAFGKEFKTDVDALNPISEGLPKFGTTAICPTVTTRELTSYHDHLAALLKHYTSRTGTKILGFHLEGPFLNPKKVGAQNADLLKTPIQCDYSNYVTGDVLIVTLSPELDGSRDLIRSLLADGKKIGVGHSTIGYSELIELFDGENMMIVHVFNAMDGLQARAPGLAAAALERDDYYVSIIADGIHVDPAVVRVVWKCKQDKGRLICITDGSAVSGLPTGTHAIGARRIQKLPDRAVLEGTSTLVGSILTQNVAARNLRSFTGCSISQAVNAVSLSPATFLGKEARIGRIVAGGAADLVVHDENFEVEHTYIDGNLVWSRGGR
jgi:N-acetylglucosamine-6-phosphate deacetylase